MVDFGSGQAAAISNRGVVLYAEDCESERWHGPKMPFVDGHSLPEQRQTTIHFKGLGPGALPGAGVVDDPGGQSLFCARSASGSGCGPGPRPARWGRGRWRCASWAASGAYTTITSSRPWRRCRPRRAAARPGSPPHSAPHCGCAPGGGRFPLAPTGGSSPPAPVFQRGRGRRYRQLPRSISPSGSRMPRPKCATMSAWRRCPSGRLPRDPVGIDDPGPGLGQHGGHRRFAARDPSCQSGDQHLRILQVDDFVEGATGVIDPDDFVYFNS